MALRWVLRKFRFFFIGVTVSQLSFLTRANPKILKKYLADISTLEWVERDFALPASNAVKNKVLSRYAIPDATWIESGTFYGNTSAFLAGIGKIVYTIEPSEVMFNIGKKKLEKIKNVTQLFGTSEDILPQLCAEIQGNICFWLDGHYSSGETYKGQNETPILEEMRIIGMHLKNYENICVFIDDVRCFNPEMKEYENYPSVSWLVQTADEWGMQWKIEHDIFICWKLNTEFVAV